MDYVQIINDFVSNLKTKQELKQLFIDNYEYIHGSTVDTIGMPMHNVGDKICYFISAFNIISRLQCTIFFEIDNLCLQEQIIAIKNKVVEHNECITEEEAKCFNKYLLIQTIIESQKQEYRNDLVSRINFIQHRLHAYLFDVTKFSSEELDNANKIDTLKQLTMQVDITYLTEIGIQEDLFINLMKLYDYNKFSNMPDIPEGIDSFIKNELDEWIEGIKECIEGVNKESEKYPEDVDLNGLKIVLPEMLKVLSSLKTSEQTVCTNSANNQANRQIKIELLGLVIDGNEPSGSLSAVPLRLFLEDINVKDRKSAVYLLDSSQLRTYNRPDGPSYIILDDGRITINNLVTKITSYDLTNYYLCGVSWNCGGKHSVVSLCYDGDCNLDTLIHTFVNETTRVRQSLTAEYTGHLCSSKYIGTELMVFENRACVGSLREAVRRYIGTSEMHMPNIHGGSVNYYDKYIKYKNKYIELKKN